MIVNPRIKKIRELRIAKRLLYLAYLLLIFNLGYFIYAENTTIGHSIYYIPIVVILPATAILFIEIYLGRKLFKSNDIASDKRYDTLAKKISGLILPFLFYPIIIAMTSMNIFDIANKIISHYNKTEVTFCTLIKIKLSSKSSKIFFSFQGHEENFSVSKKVLKPFSKVNASQIRIELTTQKGIAGFYTVKSWNLIPIPGAKGS